MQAYQKHLPEILAKGASLVAISPQTPDNSLTIAERTGLKFEVLSDVGNTVAKQFGLAFRLVDELQTAYAALGIKLPDHNGGAVWQLPIPGTYVIGTDRTIKLAHVDANYAIRLEPADILENLQGLD